MNNKRPRCIQCGSSLVYMRIKTKEQVCRNCGNIQTKRRAEADDNTKSAKASSSFEWRKQ